MSSGVNKEVDFSSVDDPDVPAVVVAVDLVDILSGWAGRKDPRIYGSQWRAALNAITTP